MKLFGEIIKILKIKYFSFEMLPNLIKSTNGSLIEITEVVIIILRYIIIKVMIGKELFRIFIKELSIP